jgi:hypothetical protein
VAKKQTITGQSIADSEAVMYEKIERRALSMRNLPPFKKKNCQIMAVLDSLRHVYTCVYVCVMYVSDT